MDEVYVLIESNQTSDGDSWQTCEVFADLDSAQKAMKKAIRKARREMKCYDTEEDYTEGDMTYSIYESGEYCYNHIDICVFQREVQ